MMQSYLDETPVTELRLPGIEPKYRGKVREIYDLGDRLLLVATDRISAFDVVLPNGIPGKGKVLTAVSLAWFRALEGLVPHHFISVDPLDYPDAFTPHRDSLAGRSMLVHKAKRFDVECVVRGYLAGSGWNEYRRTGAVCGIPLPSGLRESERLPEPVFTPATKADEGHDENISFDRMIDLVGRDFAEHLRELSISIYQNLSRACAERGFIVADTKFEFGLVGDEIVLIDEVLTPDSSRFWPSDTYEPGRSQESFDKQPVRDWLERSGWDKQPPGPVLPPDVVRATSERYHEVMRRLADPTDPVQFDEETWQ